MDNISDYWKVYHRVLLPKTAPHIPPSQTNVRKILLKRGLLFARYTSDFDCGKETEWYYVIKDDFLMLIY